MVSTHRLFAKYVPGPAGSGVDVTALVGGFLKNVEEDEATGVVTFTVQRINAQGESEEVRVPLDGSLLINAEPDVDPQPTADATTFNDRRVWWDGITLKRVARTPGHGLQVNWPDYTSSSYRGEHRDNPPNFENNQFYYHLGAHNFVYRINGRNVGGTPSGWRGHVSNQAAAEARVTANGQLFEWADNVHISSGYNEPVDDDYFWESLFGDIAHDSEKADIDLQNVDDLDEDQSATFLA